jgi:hypothetical protein
VNRQGVAEAKKSATPAPGGLLQRKCACGQHTGTGGECEECRKKKQGLQRRRGSGEEPAEVPSAVGDALRSPGRPLDAEARAFFEPRLGRVLGESRATSHPTVPQKMAISQPGDFHEREADQIAERVLGLEPPREAGPRHDLSRVRIHTGGPAEQSAREVNALAFTVGQDIVFRNGLYAPGSPSGRSLLAHELAHTAQQLPGLARAPGPLRPHDPQPKTSPGGCLGSAVCQTVKPPSQLLSEARTEQNAAAKKQREQQCAKTPPGPGCRADGHASRAVEVENLLKAFSPSRLNSAKGIFINRDLESDFGALTVSCDRFVPPLAADGQCITVPAKMEEEAALFNSTSGPGVIGGMERGLWRERTLEKLVHEAGHTRFRSSFLTDFQDQFSDKLPNILGKPRATCRADQTSQVDVFSSLNELTAMVQELPLRLERVRSSVGLSGADKAAEMEEWRDHRIRGTSQSITNSLRVIRCLCGCEDAEDMIRETIQFATSSWTQEEKNQLHREMRDPQWSALDLRWPFIAPPIPTVKRPGPAGDGLQKKLAVGPPGDSFEREADRVAEEVTGGRSGPPFGISAARPSLRRMAGTAGSGEAPAVVGEALRSPGQPLGAGVRAFMEPRIGHDFSRVRVHTGGLASRSAAAVDALAYTVGNDVVFRDGQYAPGTIEGRKLIAHELTHIVQQRESPAIVQRSPSGFFSAILRTVFRYSFKDSDIKEYLDGLEKAGDIENDYDSDLKARQVANEGKKWSPLSVKIKTLLVREMLKGATLWGDEGAIIKLFRESTPAESKAIVTTIGRKKLWSNFSGKNRKTIEALTLTAGDFRDPDLMKYLRGLSESDLVNFQNKTVDPDVPKEIDKILREKRHELVSYPEAERRKISMGGTFDASAAGAFATDLDAAKAQQNKPPAVQQTTTTGSVTRSSVEVVNVPEFRIPAGIAFEFETKIGKANRPGLERIGKHMISESKLSQNTTLNLAIKELGRIYRFTRFDHTGAAGSTELVLIEEIGPIPATAEVTETGWDVTQPRPGSMPAGSFQIKAFNFKRDKDWRTDEWDLVVAALANFPDSVLKEVAGVTFKRQPCHKDLIQNGLCPPAGAPGAGQVEAGERTSSNLNDESITLFDKAFETSPSRYGTSTVLISVLAHEVGHQVDIHPLDVALDTYNKGTAQAETELDKAKAEPPVKGNKKPKKDEKSKADLAWEKYGADKAALKEALDKSRSLSGVGWQDDGTTRTMTDAPAAGDSDFMKAAALDGLALTAEQVTSGSITEYGKKNITEQFAELFSVYMTDQKLLETIRPNVYAYFAARFPK